MVGIPLALLALVLLASTTAVRKPRRTLLELAACASAVLIIGWASDIENRVGSSFPRSFYAWATLPLFAWVVAARRQPIGARVRLAAAGALFALFGAFQINAHYGYRPTIADLLGRPLPDRASAVAMT